MTETSAEVVVDASVVVRGLTSEGDAARLLDEIAAGAATAHGPELVVAEVSNALALAVRAERRALDDAQALLRTLVDSPLVLHATTPLAPAALELAATTRLSAYDAFYAVLARSLDVPLVTADRRLSESVAGSALLE
ncbi:MAG TPA: type II toxin-antitoxin system VapC family toxin [Gaiellaceae bacterium]|nr:type II toxin-antitoxin system VapC family toxin [Gaiellaceae bacterium]